MSRAVSLWGQTSPHLERQAQSADTAGSWGVRQREREQLGGGVTVS